VYSKTAEEHARHLEVVLQKLKDNQLYDNEEKNDFVQLHVSRPLLVFVNLV
jgi:hypothetical protein